MKIKAFLTMCAAFTVLQGMEEQIGKRKTQDSTQEDSSEKKMRSDESTEDSWSSIPLEVQELICQYVYTDKPEASSVYKVVKGLKKLSTVNRAFATVAEHMLSRVLGHIKQHAVVAQQLLIRACTAGDCSLLRIMIAHNYDINKPSIDGTRALMAACEKMHYKAAELLLQAGADVNAVGQHGCTALMIACKAGSSSLVQLLLSHNPAIGARDFYGRSALHYAVMCGSKPLVKLLMEAAVSRDGKGTRANALEVDNQEKSPLEYALEADRSDLVKVMLKKQEVNTLRGHKLFDYNVSEQMLKIMRRLLKPHDYSGQPWIESAMVESATKAAKEGKIGVMDFILQSNAGDITDFATLKVFVDGFMHAIRKGNTQGVETFWNILLSRASNYIAPLDFILDSRSGLSLIMDACLHLPSSLIEKLVDQSLKERSLSEHVVFWRLLKALLRSDHEEIQAWFHNERIVDIRDATGTSLLMCAVLLGDLKMVDLLIRVGCSVNSINDGGVSVLTCAVYRGNKEIIDLLVDSGAYLQEKGGRGLIAIAAQQGHIPLIKLLLEKGANVNLTGPGDQDRGGSDALSIACASGNLDVVKLLRSYGAEIFYSNFTDALEREDKEMCLFLLGEDPGRYKKAFINNEKLLF